MDFDAWLIALKAAFLKEAPHMTKYEIEQYVDGAGRECWRESYDEGMTPLAAALSEMSYWEPA